MEEGGGKANKTGESKSNTLVLAGIKRNISAVAMCDDMDLRCWKSVLEVLHSLGEVFSSSIAGSDCVGTGPIERPKLSLIA